MNVKELKQALAKFDENQEVRCKRAIGGGRCIAHWVKSVESNDRLPVCNIILGE